MRSHVHDIVNPDSVELDDRHGNQTRNLMLPQPVAIVWIVQVKRISDVVPVKIV